jgi:hypothetical protein
VIGTIEYTLKLDFPIPLSLKSYEERIFALNMANVEETMPNIDKSENYNNLEISIEKASFNIKNEANQKVNIYAVIQFDVLSHGILTVHHKY